ncbi:MAG: DUF5916 domain-containing protein [Bacteroidetes bacterium]|nr:DUF5916 domain-containing protein [Bacteroidota bacterium]
MPRTDSFFFRTILAVLLAGTTALPALASTVGPGGEKEIPRIESMDITVDGILDEAVWQQAAVFEDFWEYLPVDGRRAQDATRVLVWYSPTAIHFGIQAWESHGNEIRATLADRDKIDGDDYVQIVLDTYNDRRQAFVIGVNPLGQQADGILSDRTSSGSNSGGSSYAYSIDGSPDFVYQSKGRLTDYGYEVEITLPFKSIRYQGAFEQDWGFNVIRRVQHSGYTSTWTPSRLDNASFMAQNGSLTGLTDLRRGLVLDINPEVTGSASRPAGSDASFKEDFNDPLGLNVRWGISSNLTLNGTINPDFSQVEADVAQIEFDPRRQVFFPEKRPFFLDGIEMFSTPTNLVYTRRIANPLSAAKVTGKTGSTNVAFLSAVDNKALHLSDLDARYFNAVRLRRDLSGQNTLGMIYTDKVDGDYWNRVAAIDGRMTFSEIYSVEWQTGMSFTADGGSTVSAPMWEMTALASGRKYGGSFSTTGYHTDFNAESGFIQRTGIVHSNFSPRRRWFGDEGAFLESYSLGITLDGTWDYDRFTAGNGPNDRKLHFNSTYAFRGGWSGLTSIFYESFLMPTGLYDNYFIETPVNGQLTAQPYVGVDRLINLGFWSRLATPRFNQFSGSLFVVAGLDDNFYEWARADIYFYTLTLNYHPTDQLRVNLLYNHQHYVRNSDKSTVALRRVPRLKVEYQLTPSLFVRLVGQYNSMFVDDLRDDSRTNLPILIRDSRGNFNRTSERRTNHLTVDWLLSYRPTPGTVLFLGYGNSSSEPDTYRFRDLQRLQDGLFFKLSYLFRV